MIATKFILQIAKTFPNSDFAYPIYNRSCVFDSQGELMGYLDWIDGDFILLKDYKHRNKAEKALDGVKYRVEKS